MRLLTVAATAVLLLLSAHHSSAFTIDPGSGTNSDGSARYVDPGDRIQSLLLGAAGSESQSIGPGHSSSQSTFPTRSLIINQGVLSPDWFFSTARPRR